MAWEIIALGTLTDADGGNLTLNEPAGTAAGDLIIACIAYKDTAAFTAPTGGEWTQIGQLNAGDTDAVGGKASGGMWFCIRGGSAPNYVWTRTLGDIARGRTVTYRGQKTTTPFDTSSTTQAGSVTEPTGTTITTAEGNELIVAMVAHGDNSTTTVMDATSPSVASNGTIDVTTEPTLDTWLERQDGGTNTGSDTGLFICDAVKENAGATGTFSALASTDSDSVMIVAAFKMQHSGFNSKVMVDGAWKSVNSAKVMVDGAWKEVNSMKVMVDGAWKTV